VVAGYSCFEEVEVRSEGETRDLFVRRRFSLLFLDVLFLAQKSIIIVREREKRKGKAEINYYYRKKK